MPQHRGRTLVMTVGTGNRDRLDDTLYTPLLKSVADGEWKMIVLLPSQETLLYAEELRGRIAHGTPGIEVNIRPLPAGHENNADRAYAHFDGVLTEVLQNNPPENVEGCGSSSLTVFPPVHRHFRPRTFPFLFFFAGTDLRTAPPRLFRAASPI